LASGTIGTAYVDVAFDATQVRRQIGHVGDEIERGLGPNLRKGQQGFDDLGRSGSSNMEAIGKKSGGLSKMFAGSRAK